MLRGHIDNVTSLGFVEGWAFETDAPLKALEISVQLGDTEVAWGLAHRFRTDLMEAGFGLGWCGFRLRLAAVLERVKAGPLRLVARSTGQEIAVASAISTIEEVDTFAPGANGLSLADPTLIGGVWQLKQCATLLMTFISQHGVETFLSVAYGYMLGRPVDHQGLKDYTQCIRQGTLTPLGVLEILERSEEFKARGRWPAAPNTECFPFG